MSRLFLSRNIEDGNAWTGEAELALEAVLAPPGAGAPPPGGPGQEMWRRGDGRHETPSAAEAADPVAMQRLLLDARMSADAHARRHNRHHLGTHQRAPAPPAAAACCCLLLPAACCLLPWL
jgi:hypothetical protein